MPTLADGFELSLESAACEAIVALLKADTTWNTYVQGRITRQRPHAADAYEMAPSLYVRTKPQSGTDNPKPGGLATPTFVIEVIYVETGSDKSEPVASNEITEHDRRRRLQQLLARGSDVNGQNGALTNLYAPPSPTPPQEFLNDEMPTFRTYEAPSPNPESATLLWILEATYKTTVERITWSRVE